MLAMLVQVFSVVLPRVQQYGSVLAITVELSDVSEANLAMLLFFFFRPSGIHPVWLCMHMVHFICMLCLKCIHMVASKCKTH